MRILAESTDPIEVRNALASFTGRCAFDVGANHGQSARVLAQHFEQVVSFEPCSESFLRLEETVPENVMCLPYAVTSHNGSVSLSENETAIESGMLTSGEGLDWGKTTGWREVTGRMLDTICLQLKLVPDFVKIDVEGHEAEVVKGGLGLFQGPAPKLLIEVHHNRYRQPIVGQLRHYVFDVVASGLTPGLPDSEGHFWLRGEPA